MCLPRPSRAAATAGGEYTVVAQLSCGVESCAPKPEASLRLRKQKRFEIFMMVVSNLLMLTPTTIFFVLLLPNHIVPVMGDWARLAFGLPAAVLFANIQLNYWASALRSPGYTTNHLRSDDCAENGKADTQCTRCTRSKPPRAHHCTRCGRCVLKMDHHCVWTNNCVGLHNYRYFMLLHLQLTMGMAAVGALSLLPILRCPLGLPSTAPCSTPVGWVPFGWVFFAFLMAVGVSLDGQFLGGQVRRLAADETTMESAGFFGAPPKTQRTPRELYVEAFERGWNFEARSGPAWTPRWRHGILLALWLHTRQSGQERHGVAKLRLQ